MIEDLLDGLEIAGIGVGMVFLALVVIPITILGLRVVIDRSEEWRRRRTTAPVASTTQEAAYSVTEAAAPASDKTARAAAIAVALFLAEEAENASER